MAEVIHMTERRPGRVPPGSTHDTAATLFFDLSSPETYFLAERVERRLGSAWWRPAVLWSGSQESEEDVAGRVRAAERRALELRMPLVWPERFPAPVPMAMRVATYAAERGRGAAFAIATGRLAFCGGFDVEDKDILAEAAAAAGLDAAEALEVARDIQRDEAIVGAGRSLWSEGATALPALQHEGHLYWGEPQIAAALTGTTVTHTNVS
jgi:2-hydroxychromene-2-carboxylate isomerase